MKRFMHSCKLFAEPECHIYLIPVMKDVLVKKLEKLSMTTMLDQHIFCIMYDL